MNDYPTTFADDVFAEQGNDLSDTAKQALARLSEKGYVVHTGLRRTDVAALHALSLQPSIREYCPNDCTKRFKDEQTTANWLEKGRLAVLLVHKKTGAIAGYGWFGPGTSEHVPSGRETFGLRVSEDHQGNGLATPFLTVILDLAKQRYEVQQLWLESWQSNAGALHVYQKLGFVTVHTEPARRPTKNNATTPDTRVYMVLA